MGLYNPPVAGATVYLGADVNLQPQNVFVNGVAVTLPPGKYILSPKAVLTNAGGAASIVAQVHNGAVAVDTCKDAISATGRSTTIMWNFHIEHAVATTYTLQVKDISSTGSILLKSTSDATTADKATQMTWTRLNP